MSELEPIAEGVLEHTDLAEEVRRLIALGVPKNTRRAYLSTWRTWSTWCQSKGLAPLPASSETVALFLADFGARRKVSTLRRHLAALAVLHKSRGLPDPTKAPQIRALLRGLAKEHGNRPAAVDALTVAELDAMVEDCNQLGPFGCARDRALLLLGFASAMRRSELAALHVDDLTWRASGLELLIRHSKTDKDSAGQVVAIPRAVRPRLCPVAHVEAWLELLGSVTNARPEKGPLWRGVGRWDDLRGAGMTGGAVARIVKRAAARSGLAPERFSGHSFRSGWATAAARAGAHERHIMQHTRHESSKTVRRYIQEADRWLNHAGAGLL